jgi:hypothetical protein
MRLNTKESSMNEEGEEIVDWDGVLSPQERQRILARLHSAFGAVGARIPEVEIIDGERVPLRDIVFDFIGKPSLTREELEKARRLAARLGRRVKELEGRLRRDQLTERAAVELMKEALGILRALQHLATVADPETMDISRRAILEKVDDERRWLDFIRKVKL